MFASCPKVPFSRAMPGAPVTEARTDYSYCWSPRATDKCRLLPWVREVRFSRAIRQTSLCQFQTKFIQLFKNLQQNVQFFFFSWFSFISSITLHQKSYKIHETVNKIFNGPFWTASSFGTLYTSCLGSSVFFFSFLHRCRKLKSQGKDSPHTATPLPTCRTRSPCAFLITKLQLYLCQGKNKLRQIR